MVSLPGVSTLTSLASIGKSLNIVNKINVKAMPPRTYFRPGETELQPTGLLEGVSTTMKGKTSYKTNPWL